MNDGFTREAAETPIEQAIHDDIRKHEKEKQQLAATIDQQIEAIRKLTKDRSGAVESGEWLALGEFTEKAIEVQFEINELRSQAQAIDRDSKLNDNGTDLGANGLQRFSPRGAHYDSLFRQLPEAKKLYLEVQKKRCLKRQIESVLPAGAGAEQSQQQQVAVKALLTEIERLKRPSVRAVFDRMRKMEREKPQRMRESQIVLKDIKQQETRLRDLQTEFEASLENVEPADRSLQKRLFDLAVLETSMRGVSNRQTNLEATLRSISDLRSSNRSRTSSRRGDGSWSPDGRYILAVGENPNRGWTLHAWDLNQESNAPAWTVNINRMRANARSDNLVYFAPNSKQAALVIGDNVVFVNVENGELKSKPAGDGFAGFGWISNDTFLVTSNAELRAVSSSKDDVFTVPRGETIEIFDGHLISIDANSVSIQNQDLQSKSTLLFDEFQNESMLTEVKADGWTNRQTLIRVELDEHYRFKSLPLD